MYGENPMASYHHTAKELEVSRWTVSRAVKDLGMKSFVRRCRALISEKARVKRVERSQDLQQWMRENPDTPVMLFQI